MMPRSPGSWRGKLASSALLLVGVALAARVAADLLLPLAPALLAVAALVTLYVLVLRR
jgi:hypothetical protein